MNAVRLYAFQATFLAITVMCAIAAAYAGSFEASAREVALKPSKPFVAYRVGGEAGSWIEASALDGTSRGYITRPTRSHRYDDYAIWSPTGESVAVARRFEPIPGSRWRARHELLLIDVDKASAMRIGALAPDARPTVAWSQDGRLVAYAFARREQCQAPPRNDVGVYVAVRNGPLRRIDGSGRRNKSAPRMSFQVTAWSTDGRHLLYAKETFRCKPDYRSLRRQLFDVAADGSERRLLANFRGTPPGSRYAFFGGATWSPDGRWIAYKPNCDTLPGDDAYCDLRVIAADRSSRRTLNDFVYGTEVAWIGPDEVAFTRGCCSRPGVVDTRLHAISAATGSTRTLGRGLPFAEFVTVSRRGTRAALAYVQPRKGECILRAALLDLMVGTVTRGRILGSCNRWYSFHVPDVG